VPDGAPVQELRTAARKIGALAASPDGRLLASAETGGATDDGNQSLCHNIRLWSVTGGTVAGVLPLGDTRIAQLRFSADGRHLIAGGDRMRIWNVADGMLLADLDGRSPFAATADGALAAVGPDGTLRLWHMPGSQPAHALDGRTTRLPGGPASLPGAVTCLTISDDDRLLAAGGADGAVGIWLLPEGRLIGMLAGQGAAVTCLTFRACGRLLAAGSADGSIRLWATGAAIISNLPAHLAHKSDLTRAHEGLHDPQTPSDERPWLALALALAQPQREAASTNGRRRVITAGAFDIEL
jgi:WD40 repeat protein